MGFNRFTRITPREYQQTIGDYTRFPFQEMYALAKENQNRQDQIDDALGKLQASEFKHGPRTVDAINAFKQDWLSKIASAAEEFAKNPNDIRSAKRKIAELNAYKMNDPRVKIAEEDAPYQTVFANQQLDPLYKISKFHNPDIIDPTTGRAIQFDPNNLPSNIDPSTHYGMYSDPGISSAAKDVIERIRPEYFNEGWTFHKEPTADDPEKGYYISSSGEKMTAKAFNDKIKNYISNILSQNPNVAEVASISPEAAQYYNARRNQNPSYNRESFENDIINYATLGVYEKGTQQMKNDGSTSKSKAKKEEVEKGFLDNRYVVTSQVFNEPQTEVGKRVVESEIPVVDIRRDYASNGFDIADPKNKEIIEQIYTPEFFNYDTGVKTNVVKGLREEIRSNMINPTIVEGGVKKLKYSNQELDHMAEIRADEILNNEIKIAISAENAFNNLTEQGKIPKGFDYNNGEITVSHDIRKQQDEYITNTTNSNISDYIERKILYGNTAFNKMSAVDKVAFLKTKLPTLYAITKRHNFVDYFTDTETGELANNTFEIDYKKLSDDKILIKVCSELGISKNYMVELIKQNQNAANDYFEKTNIEPVINAFNSEKNESIRSLYKERHYYADSFILNTGSESEGGRTSDNRIKNAAKGIADMGVPLYVKGVKYETTDDKSKILKELNVSNTAKPDDVGFAGASFEPVAFRKTPDGKWVISGPMVKEIRDNKTNKTVTLKSEPVEFEADALINAELTDNEKVQMMKHDHYIDIMWGMPEKAEHNIKQNVNIKRSGDTYDISGEFWVQNPTTGEYIKKHQTFEGKRIGETSMMLVKQDIIDQHMSSVGADNVSSRDHGLFQINDKYMGSEKSQKDLWGKYISPDKMTPEQNIELAAKGFDKFGNTHWHATDPQNPSYKNFEKIKSIVENNSSSLTPYSVWLKLNQEGIDINKSYIEKIKNEFGTDDYYDKRSGVSLPKWLYAIAMMYAESGGNPDAVNDNTSK